MQTMSQLWRRSSSVFMAVAALLSVGVGSTLIAASTSGPASAAPNCAVGVGVNIVPTVYEPVGPPPGTLAPDQNATRIGDTISYQVIADTIPGDCPFSGGKVDVYLPNGSDVTLASSLSLT